MYLNLILNISSSYSTEHNIVFLTGSWPEERRGKIYLADRPTYHKCQSSQAECRIYRNVSGQERMVHRPPDLNQMTKTQCESFFCMSCTWALHYTWRHPCNLEKGFAYQPCFSANQRSGDCSLHWDWSAGLLLVTAMQLCWYHCTWINISVCMQSSWYYDRPIFSFFRLRGSSLLHLIFLFLHL